MTGFGKVTLPQTRAGLLTQPALMSTLARENDTDPVARGKFVREVVLCQPLPAPPATVNAVPVPPDGKRQQRERLAQHSADATCAPCHALIDGIGLAFEPFDGIGKHRTADVGKPIDASGRLTGIEGEGAFADAASLARLLGASADSHRCFVRKSFEYAYGRAEAATDACAVFDLARRFEAGGGNVLELVQAIVADDAFVVRRTN
jgi:hypothetical protein